MFSTEGVCIKMSGRVVFVSACCVADNAFYRKRAHLLLIWRPSDFAEKDLQEITKEDLWDY